jgi:hypothetical protein
MLNEDDRHVGSRGQRFEELREGFEAAGGRPNAHDRPNAGAQGSILEAVVECGRGVTSVVERRRDRFAEPFARYFPTMTVSRRACRHPCSGGLLP